MITPGSTNPLLSTADAGGYQIQRSLRFNSADSAYLNRTPASAGNRKTWTWSGWLKRSSLGSSQYFMSAYTASTDAGFFGCRFTNLDVVSITGGTTEWLGTTQVFRDVSGWYHFVIAVDTTQATANNRVRFYVNGSEVTVFSGRNNPTLDDVLGYNGNWSHTISSNTLTPNQFFNGYMTEVNFIDGQALTPSSFGETDTDTGVWKPKAYSGSYGTNGFYLKFADNSGTTSTTLGKDSSGNGNNWTPNNFSVTAGAGNDSLVDSPTAYGTDTGAGGEVRGNYCTLNPLNNAATSLVNGNLDSGTASGVANWLPTSGTIGVSSGKWYWEVRMNSVEYLQVGIFPNTYAAVSGTYPGSASTSGYGYQSANGNKYVLGTGSSYGATFTTGDVIGVALDLDAGTLVFYKNGVSQGTAASSISGTFVPGIAVYNSTGASTVANCNFGQRPFAYTAPSGFKALCTQNLPTPTIGATATTRADDYFNTVLYTGTGSSLGVTGVGFQPDFVWIKERSGAADHGLYDAVRGVQKQLESNNTDAETTETTGLTAFNSDGFTVGSLAQLNTNTATYASWNWKANGAGSSNTAGTITSTVSANTTAGFSIVTYTGNGTSGATVGHGLGVEPGMAFIKNRTTAGQQWVVYHKFITPNPGYRLVLNDTSAAASNSTIFNGTATPASSTTLTLGTSSEVNTNGDNYVGYFFAPVAGYSAFGSFTGNASTDGPMIYTGFRPRWILIKNSSATGDWVIFDTSRDPYNMEINYLVPNSSIAETSGSSVQLDGVSNGFKIRGTWAGMNGSGNTIVYAAFAEVPLKYSLAR